MRSTRHFVTGISALACVALVATASAQSGKSSSNDPESKSEPAPEDRQKAGKVDAPPPGSVVYRPPARGKPRARIGGGVRGVDRMWPSLFALVPDHAGQTISAQPSFFWYVDSLPEPGTDIVFTLVDEDGVEPLVEAKLPRPAEAGIQRTDLAALGGSLEAGRAYEWSVAIVADPDQRANDIVTAGWIDRIQKPPDLAGSPDAGAYAERGLWYDALAAAADRMRAEPESAEARSFRNSLLLQVGLGAATPGR